MGADILLTAIAFTLCADFTLFPDDTKMGKVFHISGYEFRDLTSDNAKELFINQSGSERGLQFYKEGMAIVLPVPSEVVDLRIGTFAGEIDIVGKDQKGTVVTKRKVPGLSKFVDIKLVGTNISEIEITSGGNEAALAKLCVAIATC
jgi:hypothetical protein